MEDRINAILKSTYTKQQLLQRQRLVKDFLSFLLYTQESKTRSFNQNVQAFFEGEIASSKPELVTENSQWLIELGDKFFGSFTVDNLSSSVEQIEKYISDLKPIIVYLPLEMPNKNLEDIGRWFKTNLGTQAIFEPSFDGNLIGGCAISYRGVYKDFSVRANLAQSKQVILESLRSFKNG